MSKLSENNNTGGHYYAPGILNPVRITSTPIRAKKMQTTGFGSVFSISTFQCIPIASTRYGGHIWTAPVHTRFITLSKDIISGSTGPIFLDG